MPPSYLVRRYLPFVAGPAALLASWQLVASESLPAPSAVVHAMTTQYGSVLITAAAETLARALKGLALAAVAAGLAAVAVYLAPLVRSALFRFGVGINALPIIAIGPFLVATAGSENAAIGTAAIAAYFVLFVSVTSGLESAGQAETDLFRALGAGKATRLRHLNGPSAIPLALDGIKVAVPAALLGAILGEWFGAENGIGILLLSAMGNVQIELMWSAAVIAGAVSLVAYGVAELLSRIAVRRYPRPAISAHRLQVTGVSLSRSMAGRWLTPLLTLGMAVGAWAAYVEIKDVPALILPGPGQVISYLGDNIGAYADATVHTLIVASSGLAAGTLIGGVLAVAMARWRGLGAAVMPLALIVPSVPIIIVIPLLAQLLGYNDRTVLGVAVLTSFFPALVFVRAGLNALPPSSDDLMASLGVPAGRRLRLLQLPAAVPHALVGLRFSAGVCLLTALTAEWLIGTSGLGWMYGQGSGLGNVNQQWGAILVIIALAVVFYELATAVESVGRRRFG